MSTLGVVPARAGSKGIPHKNRRNFMGKPLVSWAIECAKRTCDSVVVSTDDPVILEVAEEYGVEALTRPHDLAQDETPMLDVLRHALACSAKPPNTVVLVQATQPLRRDEHILKALELLSTTRGIDSVVSVVRIPEHYSPDFALYISQNRLFFYGSGTVTRRQDCRPAYYRDGTVYAMKRDILERGQIYGHSLPMIVNPADSCTLDTEDDWKRAEQMWRQRNG